MVLEEVLLCTCSFLKQLPSCSLWQVAGMSNIYAKSAAPGYGFVAVALASRT